MKPKNFPARKLMRQLNAKARMPGGEITPEIHEKAKQQLLAARDIRTKKHR